MSKNKIKVVGFLQNAWSPYFAGGHWPRRNWLEALKRSRTGQRLKHMDHEQIEMWYDESTPEIADNPKTVLPADLNHMRKVLREQQPKYIVTFGMPAMKAMKLIRPEFQGPGVMCLPHPCCRVVTNELFIGAREHLVGGFAGWCQYKQEKFGFSKSFNTQLNFSPNAAGN